MNMCRRGAARRLLRSVVAVVGVILALGAMRPAYAADRAVLCEEFSDISCFGCAYAGPALSNLLDVFPETFTFVQYHVSDGYNTPWSEDRWAFHAGQYTPTIVFDGVDKVVGSVPDSDQEYTLLRANHFLPQRDVATDVTLTVSAAPVSGQTYHVSATVGIEAGGTGKTMRVYVVQVLDHWPPEKPYHRNCFKQATSTVDVTLAPGESETVEHDLTFDADSWAAQEDIKLIAWVQEPLETAPVAVYQSTTKAWPLLTAPGDYDGDGWLDGVDNCPLIYQTDQADSDGDLAGDLCDNCDGLANPDQTDQDEDSYGDACDNCPVLHALNQTDTDGDEVGNPCDSCPDVSAPGGVDQFGRSWGTIDLDCDVDLTDLRLFTDCLAGPDTTVPPPGCDWEEFWRSDTDGDNDADLGDFKKFALNFTGPLVSPPLYVGSDSCTSCHSSNHTAWAQTIHATAFDTLVNGGDGDNVLCFPCHSVGYGQPSGFVDLGTTPHLADVQCENCHGPGSNHVSSPGSQSLEVHLEAALCGACHQSCHGLCGEDHHPQYEQWQESKHEDALWDMMFEPDAEDSCLQCHSVDYRLAPVGDKPTLFEAWYGLDCVTCHDPHGSENTGQLRLPTYELCADCHNMQGALPPDAPLQPQSETLHGYGGFRLDGRPLDGPYSAHWWNNPDECVTCHVHSEPYGGPQQPVNSGHTFESNMRACAPCHTEEVATLLVAVTREEVEARLAVIAPYYDEGDPLYVDPETLTPEERAVYDVAKFNYEFVIEDGSFGTHNANYMRALLGQTESYFGIDPRAWLSRLGRGDGGK